MQQTGPAITLKVLAKVARSKRAKWKILTIDLFGERFQYWEFFLTGRDLHHVGRAIVAKVGPIIVQSRRGSRPMVWYHATAPL